ncbi:MAG: outer membrane protein transport protein [Hyphomicrobiaceae bacterium]|nr:outer membrane protein transport protein [Hyphomicrobiaceae bacterium]
MQVADAVESLKPARAIFVALAAAAAIVAATPASAAEGYMQNGIGARNKALAGAGVASSTDATAASLNPAGLTGVESQLDSSTSFFNMRGGFSSTGSGGFTADGSHTSQKDWLVIPNFAATWRVNWGFADAIAFTAYGNGGVMTRYADMPNTSSLCSSGSGAYCGGRMGMVAQQQFFSIALAKQVSPGVSIGIAPILARQTMEVEGLSPFAGLSSNSAAFTNRGTDESWGGGVRAGIEWKVMPGLRFGLAGNSRVYMGKLNRYAGLFAEEGSIDAPPSLQAGLAFDVRPNLTMMLDYKRIWFSSVRSLSNASTNIAAAYGGDPSYLFGTTNGPGFGMQDMDIYKIALEWKANPNLTLRGGYSYNTAPFSSRDADLTAMTLGLAQHHLTAGLKVGLTERMDLEVSGMYSPRMTLSGEELLNPNRIMTTESSQFEITVGAVYRFGVDRAAPAPLK